MKRNHDFNLELKISIRKAPTKSTRCLARMRGASPITAQRSVKKDQEMELYVKRVWYIGTPVRKFNRLEKVKIHSGFSRFYGIDCEVYWRSNMHVAYHREDCVIPVYVRGNFCLSSSKDNVVDYDWNMNSSNKSHNAANN